MIRSDQPYSLHGRILIVAHAASCTGRHGIGPIPKLSTATGGAYENVARHTDFTTLVRCSR